MKHKFIVEMIAEVEVEIPDYIDLIIENDDKITKEVRKATLQFLHKQTLDDMLSLVEDFSVSK